ncbi:hypothetical protein [Nocardia goodfellowii]|uniref:Uncharacterized protein n=1 Tax=Nocardia goodfellowii TaxID=882446 RepID=A0ABS4QQB4_9NOCA|nr:hypothetical protein [Nocardia goodfellowii]MBP2193906.1 hypothetical protein [Nocardia goodfellowii]
MSPTCPSCSWPSPMHVSSHRSVRYLRCVCGEWLIARGDAVTLMAGRGCATAPEHLELIPLPEE